MDTDLVVGEKRSRSEGFAECNGDDGGGVAGVLESEGFRFLDEGSRGREGGTMEWRWVVEAGQAHCGKWRGRGKGYRFMSFQGRSGDLLPCRYPELESGEEDQ